MKKLFIFGLLLLVVVVVLGCLGGPKEGNGVPETDTAVHHNHPPWEAGPCSCSRPEPMDGNRTAAADIPSPPAKGRQC